MKKFNFKKTIVLCFALIAMSTVSEAQCDSDVNLFTQAQVNAFSCTTLEGTLTIFGNDITDLSALSSLNYVSGSVLIYNSNNLPDLDGLSSLTSIGGDLHISNLPLLTNIDGLSNLTTVDGYLYSDGNNILTDVNGLSSLTSLGNFLALSYCSQLAEFCGIYPLINNGFSGAYIVAGNAQNPTKPAIIAAGPCVPAGCDNFQVNLKDSNGDVLAGGSLEYREGGGSGWQAATEISDGLFCIDTDRSQIGLRMTYGPQVQKEGGVPTNSDYTFQTVNVTVALEDAGTPVDGGTVEYTSDGWHSFGTTGDDGTGSVSQEMLPLQYTFKMTYDGDKENKTELISSGNNLISFEVADLKSGITNENMEIQLVAYPNPFSGNTTIAFSLEKAEEVSISVYDVNGKLIEILHEGMMEEGNHKINWNASEIQKGIYMVRFSSNGNVVHKNMVKM